MAAAAAAKLVVGPFMLLLQLLLMFMGEEIDMSDDNGNDEVGRDCGVEALLAPPVVLLPTIAPPPLTPPLVVDET